jgi:hypothetical protein
MILMFFLGLIEHKGKLQETKTNRQAYKQNVWTETRRRNLSNKEVYDENAKLRTWSDHVGLFNLRPTHCIRNLQGAKNSSMFVAFSGPKQKQMKILFRDHISNAG